MNCFRKFINSTSNDVILTTMRSLQSDVHMWGDANFVKFDSAKESLHILSRHNPSGDSFKILGCQFDCKLVMHECIHDLVSSVNWKIRLLIKISKFYDIHGTINLYKSHVLSYIEYRTPAIFHASNTVLMPLDLAQNRFLHSVGISVEEAAQNFKLLPLRCRRQIAMLGIIQRAILKRGPYQFWQWFEHDSSANISSVIKHTRAVKPLVHHQAPDYLKRSLLGMIKIFNGLPQFIVDIPDVKLFQRELQNLILNRMRHHGDWLYMFDASYSFIYHSLFRGIYNRRSNIIADE